MFLLRIDGVPLLEHPLTSPSHSECYLQAAGRSWKCLSLSLCGPGVLSFTVTDEYLFFILGPVKKAREERGGCCCSVCHWSRGFPVDLRFLQAAWARARAWPYRRWGRGALPVLCCSLLVSTPTFSSSKFRRCGFVLTVIRKRMTWITTPNFSDLRMFDMPGVMRNLTCSQTQRRKEKAKYFCTRVCYQIRSAEQSHLGWQSTSLMQLWPLTWWNKIRGTIYDFGYNWGIIETLHFCLKFT